MRPSSRSTLIVTVKIVDLEGSTFKSIFYSFLFFFEIPWMILTARHVQGADFAMCDSSQVSGLRFCIAHNWALKVELRSAYANTSQSIPAASHSLHMVNQKSTRRPTKKKKNWSFKVLAAFVSRLLSPPPLCWNVDILKTKQTKKQEPIFECRGSAVKTWFLSKLDRTELTG